MFKVTIYMGRELVGEATADTLADAERDALDNAASNSQYTHTEMRRSAEFDCEEVRS